MNSGRVPPHSRPGFIFRAPRAPSVQSSGRIFTNSRQERVSARVEAVPPFSRLPQPPVGFGRPLSEPEETPLQASVRQTASQLHTHPQVPSSQFPSHAVKHEVYLRHQNEHFSKIYHVVPWTTNSESWYWLVEKCDLYVTTERYSYSHITSVIYANKVVKPVLHSYLTSHGPPPWQ